MLKKRLLASLVLIPLVTAAVWFDEPLSWLTVFIAVWGGLAVIEFYRMVSVSKALTLTGFGFIGTILLIISPHIDSVAPPHLILTTLAIVSLVWIIIRGGKGAGFTGWVWTMSGAIYVGLLLSYMVGLRELDMGREWVLFALFATFASDSAAYLIGSRWGRRHLSPEISPKKTWEGCIAGLIAAALFGFALKSIFGLPIGYFSAGLLGLAVSMFGQFGDLVESLFKRSMRAKDSGNAIPGHGGFLDRIDSVVFAGIVVYYYVIWFIQ